MIDLSTKWWNVIRRKMSATDAKEYPSAKCPDCGSQMHLMRGKFGRFYKCCRFDCSGTLGAALDGKPRKPKGPRALIRARRDARDAIQLVVTERDHAKLRANEIKAIGGPWWNEPHELACCKEDFRAIVFTAKLPPIPVARRRGREWAPLWAPVGLFLRKRSIEE